jgi:2-dehydro-3-deoxy-D-arabinonate dehydratase
MNLTRHSSPSGPRWAADGHWLPRNLTLAKMLSLPTSSLQDDLRGAATSDAAAGPVLAPLEDHQEVWASGVTYLRSRQAREAESATGDIYQRVYTAERPELFFKAPGWRVIHPGGEVRVRADSRWNVPEPELTLVINSSGDIVGFTAGNDVSSRDIEGENPLYLPQAKVYTGSCALGPSIQLVDGPAELRDLPIFLQITRSGTPVFQGETRTGMMKRNFEELASYLFRELDFPHGALLMTGTGIVPPEAFSLRPGDDVRVTVGSLVLQNRVKG